MIIDKSLVAEAKNKLGEKAAYIIAADLQLDWDDKYLKSLCPNHSEDTPSFIWDGKENANFFYCFGCGYTYNIIDHYISYYKLTYLEAVEKLFSEVGIKYRFSEKGLKANRDYKYPHYIASEDRSLVEQYCLSREISKETLDYCDVKQGMDGNLIWNFYDENDTLLTVKCRAPKNIKKTDIKEWFLPNYDSTPILFNMNKIDISKPLVITEGQFDTLSVIESGYTNCVSVPGGSENLKWIETCFDWLEQFDKIIFFGDNDAAGIKMRKEAASRIGAWKCLYVDLPQEIEINGQMIKVKDANDVLIAGGKGMILDFIKNAQEIPIQGIVNLADVDDFDLENAPGLYTHLKPIDKIVYKFLFGSVLILTGKRGSGKSAMLNQLFINESLDQGQDVFCYSGELDAKVLKSWIEINMAGREHIKMKDDFIHIIDSETKKSIKEWYDGRIWIYDENTNNADKILEKAIALTRKNGVKIWVIDNLMCLDIDSNDTNLWQKQKDFIIKLTGLAKLYNVLIILVIHPRKTNSNFQSDLTADDISGAGELGNAAQYIVSVHRFSKLEKEGEKDGKGNYKKGKEPIEEDVAVDILKNRYTGKLDRALLNFSYPDYRFYGTNQELYKRYKWNKDTSQLPTENPKKNNEPDFMKD